MKGRARRGGRASSTDVTDLMACLPPRAQLTLMPKPICSPSRAPAGANHRNPVRPRTRLSVTKDKNYTSPEIAEPASPKVTCSGQIKRSSKSRTCSKASCDGGTRSSVKKNWLSIVEEIEKLLQKQIKKDAVHLFAAIRGLRCFSAQWLCSLQGPVDSATDEEEEGAEREEEKKEVEIKSPACRTTSLECLMMLEGSSGGAEEEGHLAVASGSAVSPPPNALLLMRCRSAPAKGGLRGGGGGRQVAAGMAEENKREEVKIISIAGNLSPFTRSQSCTRWQRKEEKNKLDNGVNLSTCPPPPEVV